MNEQQRLISETLNRLLTDLCTPEVVDQSESGTFAENLWQALTETGLTAAGLEVDAGGSGGDLEDSLLAIREAARFAAPVPLAAAPSGGVGFDGGRVDNGESEVD